MIPIAYNQDFSMIYALQLDGEDVSGLTLASGDAKIITRDGTDSNLDTLPTMTGTELTINISAAETQSDYILHLRLVDQSSSKEWDDDGLLFEVVGHPDHPGYKVSTINDKTGYKLASDGLDTVSIAVDTINDKTGYTVDTVNDKTGYKLASDGLDTVSIAVDTINDKTGYTVDTVNDKTGYKLASDGLDTVSIAVDTVNDKTGYKLASDGLDTVSITGPNGVASNFREMVIQLWRRFFGKATITSSTLTTTRDDGSTSATTQALSDDGTTQTQGEASDA